MRGRTGCRAARELLRTLAAAAPASPQSADAMRLDDLCLLLETVAGGEAVCIDPDGRVVVPGFAERRRQTRIGVNQQAEICFGANVYPIRMIDASSGGLGIEGPYFLLQGDAVTVRVADGRKLRAHVAWVNGSRAGLRLTELLHASDPLLSGEPLASRSSAAA